MEAVIERAVPPLALALAASTSSQLRLEDLEPELRKRFIPAVAALDDADRAYRRTIEEILPRDSAAAILSAMAAFREKVHEARERALHELAELYRRYDRAYGWFDPLDPSTPPAHGLSHADGTRAAAIADRARSGVDALRAQVNETVTKQLEPAQIDALINAKRRRRAIFESALKQTLEGALASHVSVTSSEVFKTLAQLTQVADAWY